MKKLAKDPVREDRIHNEAIADANGPEEANHGIGIATWMTKSGSLFKPDASLAGSFHRSREGETVEVHAHGSGRCLLG